MTENEFADLAAAYALGALDPAERAAVERALAEHPEWEHHVDAELAAAAQLAEAVPSEAPRAAVKDLLFAELDARIAAGERPSALRTDLAPQIPVAPVSAGPLPGTNGGGEGSPAEGSSAGLPPLRNWVMPEADPEDELPPRKRGWVTRVLAVVAVAALIAGVGSGLFSALQPQQPAGVVALEQLVAAPDAQRAATQVPGGGEAALTWSAEQGRAVLVTAGLPAAPSGHTYELWFVRGEEKIPAGTFDPDERGVAAVLVDGEMHAGDTIAVTVEVTGGSPNGLPSDQLVFAIPTGSSGQST